MFSYFSKTWNCRCWFSIKVSKVSFPPKVVHLTAELNPATHRLIAKEFLPDLPDNPYKGGGRKEEVYSTADWASLEKVLFLLFLLWEIHILSISALGDLYFYLFYIYFNFDLYLYICIHQNSDAIYIFYFIFLEEFYSPKFRCNLYFLFLYFWKNFIHQNSDAGSRT